MSELVRISEHQPDSPTGDLVFVHGLGGDEQRTWCGKQGIRDCWLAWLAEDLPDVTVWSLRYAASAVKWKDSTMPLTDRSTNVLATLEASGIGKQRVVFVAYSLGGLVIKQLLRSARDYGNAKWRNIADQTAGVIFISTPHAGTGLASWLTRISVLVGFTDSVGELQANEPSLRDLNTWYRNNASTMGIKTEVYFEKQDTRGSESSTRRQATLELTV